MTHSPPVPAANQAPYPIASASGPDTDKAALVARMKSNGEDRKASAFPLSYTLLAAAVIAAGVGYALWSGRAGSADRIQKKVPAAPRA